MNEERSECKWENFQQDWVMVSVGQWQSDTKSQIDGNTREVTRITENSNGLEERENIRRDFGKQKTYKFEDKKTQTFIFGKNKNEFVEKERRKQKNELLDERKKNENELFFWTRERNENEPIRVCGVFSIHKPFGNEKNLFQWWVSTGPKIYSENGVESICSG